MEEMARVYESGFALSLHSDIVVPYIHAFGTADQKRRWLPGCASGDLVTALAMTEPGTGSDAANQQTSARLDDRGYVLNGRKVWVANAEAADLAIVFALTDDGASQRGGARHITAFVLPMKTPGLERALTADSLGVRGLGCMDLELKNVRLGEDAVLGAPGDGFRVAMWALDGGRIAIAAQALGVGEAALDEALAHAKTREAFGQPIANYQAIQWMLADSATELDAAKMLMLKAAAGIVREGPPPTEPGAVTLDAAMAKLFASEAAHRAADRAMQILASKGYRRGSVVERLFRDVRATEIYQGTSEIQRMVIAEHILS
jgi:butyryl-CoA dehydrogenase